MYHYELLFICFSFKAQCLEPNSDTIDPKIGFYLKGNNKLSII